MRLWGQIFKKEIFWVAGGHEHSNDENCHSESEGGGLTNWELLVICLYIYYENYERTEGL